MRAKKDNDITFEVDGIGAFRYGRKTLGDSLKIRAIWLDMVGKHSEDEEMAGFANIVAVHRVLCVEAPDGWGDLESLDSVKHPNLVVDVINLYEKYRETEDSFRGAPKGASAEGGA